MPSDMCSIYTQLTVFWLRVHTYLLSLPSFPVDLTWLPEKYLLHNSIFLYSFLFFIFSFAPYSVNGFAAIFQQKNDLSELPKVIFGIFSQLKTQFIQTSHGRFPLPVLSDKGVNNVCHIVTEAIPRSILPERMHRIFSAAWQLPPLNRLRFHRQRYHRSPVPRPASTDALHPVPRQLPRSPLLEISPHFQ